MCLAFLLARYRDCYSPRSQLHAVTVDHAYRPGSEHEAREVGRIAESWRIRHSVLRLDWPSDPRSLTNFEEAAREQRLAVLRDFCVARGVSAVFMGHNQNDVLETFLQRLSMNSTVYGLVGLRPRAPFPGANFPHPVSIMRPLLPFDKPSIVATCRANSVPWVEDSTNADIHLTKRNMLRHALQNVVPKRPDLQAISHANLVSTVSELSALLRGLEHDVRVVRFPDFYFDSRKHRFSFSMTPDRFWGFQRLEFLVFSRWLYHQMTPLSASKHLHWAYAKIHRQLVPALVAFVESSSSAASFCYLNVKLSVTKKNGRLHFSAANEVPRNYSMKVGPDWRCFARMWWFKTDGPVYEARFYHPSLKRRLLASFPDWNSRTVMKDLGNVPVIMSGELIVGIPTWGRWLHDVSVTCVPVLAQNLD